MNIYLVERTDNISYDELSKAVVIAETNQMAKAVLAAEYSYFGVKTDNTKATKIGESNKRFSKVAVIVTDIYEG